MNFLRAIKETGFIIQLLLFTIAAHASIPIVLSDPNKDAIIKGKRVDILEDTTGLLTIEDVTSAAYFSKFIQRPIEISINENKSSAYWLRFEVHNRAPDQHWMFELLDPNIDDIEFYIPKSDGTFLKKTGGDSYIFDRKEVRHKNFVFKIPASAADNGLYYVRVKSKNVVALIAKISSFKLFTAYADAEYYLLAIFYGIILAMIIYNLLLYLTLKDYSYLFYIFYVASIGLYTSTKDGTGFQYLWPAFPDINKDMSEVAVLLMVFFAVLFAKNFLKTKEISSSIDKLLSIIIVVRIVIFFTDISFFPDQQYFPYIDIGIFIVIFVIAIKSLKKGNYPARLIVIGLGILFVCLAISLLRDFGLIRSSLFTVYSFNVGVIGKVLLFSLALSDRIKFLMKENEKAQREMLGQLYENEQIKDSIFKGLEQKVKHRTRELEEKNSMLDTFVFKATNDIKGPLKSIIHLTNKALTEVKEEESKSYLQHVLRTSSKLNKVLEDLDQMEQVKRLSVNCEIVDFQNLIDEVLTKLESTEGFEKVKINVHLKTEFECFSDCLLLKIIFENLIENAIKYHDPEKEHSFLNITVASKADTIKIEFADNGLGIEKDLHPQVFEVFFKVYDSSNGSGLGLHMIKMCVEKLNGSITFKSEAGLGTSFNIEIPNVQRE